MASCPHCGHPVEDGPPVAGVTNRELRDMLWDLTERLDEINREMERAHPGDLEAIVCEIEGRRETIGVKPK